MRESRALSGATTRELVSAAQGGGPKALAAQNYLIQANEGLCRAVVRRMCPCRCEPDEDLIQEARLALSQAIKRYRPESGAGLATFAWTVMQRAVAKAIRRENRAPSATSLENVSELQLQHIESCDHPYSFDDRFAVRELVRSVLSSDDREILWRLFWHGEQQKEIAHDFGCSHTAVQKRQKRILNTLRYALTA